MFEKIKARRAMEREKMARKKEERRLFNESTTFSKDEKMLLELIVKCDFSKSYFSENMFRFRHNELRLEYDRVTRPSKYDYTYLKLFKKDNPYNSLMKVEIGEAKARIIDKIISDKKKAFIEKNIISSPSKKGVCTYCNTVNEKGRTNCINCAAVIKHNG